MPYIFLYSSYIYIFPLYSLYVSYVPHIYIYSYIVPMIFPIYSYIFTLGEGGLSHLTSLSTQYYTQIRRHAEASTKLQTFEPTSKTPNLTACKTSNLPTGVPIGNT